MSAPTQTERERLDDLARKLNHRKVEHSTALQNRDSAQEHLKHAEGVLVQAEENLAVARAAYEKELDV